LGGKINKKSLPYEAHRAKKGVNSAKQTQFAG
jgi:hypothetical protein